MIRLAKSNQTLPPLIAKTLQTKQTPFCIGISATEHFIPTPHPGHPQTQTI